MLRYSLFKSVAAPQADTMCYQTRKCLWFLWTVRLETNMNKEKQENGKEFTV